ncbi:MAG: glycosyl hydrolase, partial [Deltaproteobacteria bacterium]|nr:glycosyl hydrolase [Deltaproteobacteria bacterium]
ELAAAKAAAAGDAAAQRRLAEAERLVSDGPDKPFLGVFFPDEQNGFALGAYGLIFGTTDGGETWRSLQPLLDNPKSRHLYAMGAVGRDWYVAGEQGLVFRSEDAGKSFVPVNTPYTGSYFGILSGAKAELFVFGLRGNVYRSEDGGSTWTKIETGVPASVTGGTRLGDGSLVLVDEAGRLVRSDDGGRTFRPIPVPQPLPFTGVVQASDGNVVASGVAGVNRLVVTGNSNRGESKP